MVRAAYPLLLGVALGCRSQSAADSAAAAVGAKSTDQRSTAQAHPVSSSAQLLQSDSGSENTGPSGVAGLAGTDASGSPCPEPRDVPQLKTFIGAKMHERYWVVMRFSDGAWRPEPMIRPAVHHRSGLALDNLEAFPELDRQRALPVRLTVELIESDIQKIPDRYEWRSVFHAQIVEVCALPTSP